MKKMMKINSPTVLSLIVSKHTKIIRRNSQSINDISSLSYSLPFS